MIGMEQMNNIPCVCGHIELSHACRNAPICSECWFNSGAFVDQIYHEYKPNNLKLIEKAYEESKHE